MASKREELLSVKGLEVEFRTRRGTALVLNGVEFNLYAGETLGVVGESGCGKSMTALVLLRLIPSPPGKIRAGEIHYGGEDLTRVSEKRMREIRGNRISMIFQEPLTALNPVFTVGAQIGEALQLHEDMSRSAARAKAIELLDQVGIPAPGRRVDEYPHQMSGGMRQRVMIAMALACRPEILVADEPTTALDVTVQAQIFDLLRQLQKERGTAILMITHDMGAIAEMADRVMVMYAGRVVERGTTEQILRNPAHPYTQGLIACLPKLGSSAANGREELTAIPGVVPSIWELGRGCAFRDRCPYAMPVCAERVPPMLKPDEGGAVAGTSEPHTAACWLYAGDVEKKTPSIAEAR